jgi:hypothetical protein
MVNGSREGMNYSVREDGSGRQAGRQAGRQVQQRSVTFTESKA